MSQNFTDDCFASSHGVQTDMQNMENNFACLKSSFSGTSAPTNTTAGMFWWDTTNDILKMRNLGDTGWLSIWNLADDKPIISHLSAEIIMSMCAASMKDPAAVDEGLRSLGTGAQQACSGSDTRLTDARTPPDASVSQAKLKTGSYSAGTTSMTGVNMALTGGLYAFYPQLKSSAGAGLVYWGHASGNYCAAVTGTTFTSTMCLRSGTSSLTASVYQVFITSSGEITWIFILRDKITKAVIATVFSTEHPCFGNGGKPKLVPHPFMDFNPDLHEIIVINPSPSDVAIMEAKCIVKDESKPDRGIIDVLMEDYEIDESLSPKWPRTKVTVGLPKGYEKLNIGDVVKPIRKVIPKPSYVIVRSLKRIK